MTARAAVYSHPYGRRSNHGKREDKAFNTMDSSNANLSSGGCAAHALLIH